MMRPEFLNWFLQPVSMVMAIINIAVYAYLLSHPTIVEKLVTSADAVLGRGEYWRVVTSSFTHVGILHLGMNIGSAWMTGALEQFLSWQEYLSYIVILVVTGGFVDAIIRQRFLPTTTSQTSLGYSLVVFGLQSIVALKMETVSIMGFQIPWSIMPFVNLVVVQLLIPGVSLIGHLAGIVVGFLVGWHAFDWFSPTVMWNVLPWLVVVFLGSWAKTRAFARFQITTHRPLGDVTMVGGRLIAA
jgi:membrane associated rhomboid family serine protease